MSIIHDALKKVQSSLQKNPNPVAEETITPTTGIVPEPFPPSPVTSKNNTAILVFSSILLIIIFAYLLIEIGPRYLPFLKPIIHRASKYFVKPLGPIAKISTSQTLSESEQSNVLSIQGVMSNGNSTVALINGKITLVGDTLNGVKILEINSDTIKLLRDGKEEIVQVHP